MTLEDFTALIEPMESADVTAVLGLTSRVASLEAAAKDASSESASDDDKKPDADAFGDYVKSIHGLSVDENNE